jgi:hypothetical protein
LNISTVVVTPAPDQLPKRSALSLLAIIKNV